MEEEQAKEYKKIKKRWCVMLRSKGTKVVTIRGMERGVGKREKRGMKKWAGQVDASQRCTEQLQGRLRWSSSTLFFVLYEYEYS